MYYTPTISVPDTLALAEGQRVIYSGPDCTTLAGAIGWIAARIPALARNLEVDEHLFPRHSHAIVAADLIESSDLYAEIERW